MDSKRKAHWTRRGAFAATLLAALAAALSPDWSAVLKAQNYAGYVDLVLNLLPSGVGSPVAGTDTDFLLTTSNNGPEVAVHPRVLMTMRGAVQVGATSGCLDDPVGYPLCHLSDPLFANSAADFLLHTHLPATARGEVQLAAVAMSDSDESLPGDEIAFYHAPIAVQANISAFASCGDKPPRFDRPVTCAYLFRNIGPSSSNAAISAGLYVPDGVAWTCQATRPELCGSLSEGEQNAWLALHDWMPGEEISLTATGTPGAANWLNGFMVFDAFASPPSSEPDPDLSDNWRTNQIEIPLFVDGFDSN